MSDWQQIIKDQSISSLEKLAEKFGADVIDVEALKPAFDNFQMRITPAALEQIKEVGDPMWQQYVPTVEELDVVDGVIDSLDEDGDSPVPNITHRYPDRALFLVSPVCATYCRFCTRRRKVGDPEKIPLNQYDSAFQYLREHTEIRDVIMSGGDPMMLSDRRLEYLFQQLSAALDAGADDDPAFLAELDRRLENYRTGQSPGVPADEVFRRLRETRP